MRQPDLSSAHVALPGKPMNAKTVPKWQRLDPTLFDLMDVADACELNSDPADNNTLVDLTREESSLGTIFSHSDLTLQL